MAAIAEDMYEPDALQLLTPNGGERWIAGKTYTISWSYTGSISLVVIEYSLDLGVTWTSVGPPVPSDSGGYDWRIPAISTNQCLIRISSAENPNISDTSDEAFMLFIRATIYVDTEATGANDGTSWENAYTFLQDALATAKLPDVEKPLEVRVAQGTYKPNQGLIPIVAPGTPGRGGPSPGVWPADKGVQATFSLINGAVIKGGYAGLGEPDPNARDIELYQTVLSGDLSGDDIEVDDLSNLLDEPTRSDNSMHVITSAYNDANAVISGFTVTGGRDRSMTFGGRTGGAGIILSQSNPTLIECTFTRNAVLQAGGGMFNISSSPTLINCVFTENYAEWGAGIYNGSFPQTTKELSSPKLINCTFTDNYARWIGGGIYNEAGNSSLLNCKFSRNFGAGFCGGGSPEFVDCEFIQNTGGGVYSSGSPILTNCIFRSNSTKGEGGGMYSEGTYDIILTDCIFSGNSAGNKGGGLATHRHEKLVLNNCIFTGNKVYGDKPYQDEGGGCYLFGDNTTMTNCTFYGNWAKQDRAISKYSDSDLRLINCILWDGDNGISKNNPSTLAVTYSDIQGGLEGEGNINVDPLFTDPGYWANVNDPDIVVEPNDPNAVWIDGDYHLKSQAGRWNTNSQTWNQDDGTSPCIDTGDPNNPIGHEPVPNGGIINMGAYGGRSQASKSYFGWPICETIVAGDINGDCKVDFRDFVILAYHWLGDSNP
ncbi:MAG: right-handed parallel beta-helix repeat-containing protein [Planctomycetota bacterium]|nr:MAG: right-handed parallel beta-helix repeat-containing protein [Planctomycetota bacterium]